MDKTNGNVINILSRDTIIKKAREKWNSKGSVDKNRCGNKYRHVFEKLKLPQVSWDNPFDELSKSQINILIKGELIRTYDSMPNRDKTRIKEHFELSEFSSKWFRLSPSDKKILLNSVLKHDSKNQ
jgi:hypothetical protein